MGAQLPVDVERSPREMVEAAVDALGMRVTAARAAPQREGHERFTLGVFLHEEQAVLDLVDAEDVRAQIWVTDEDTAGLSADQAARCVPLRARRGWCVHSVRRPGRARPPRCARWPARRAGSGVR